MPPRNPVARYRPRGNAWIRAACDALIRHGVEYVKIERLAVDPGATRAAFYYQFNNRLQILDVLLAYWYGTNTRMFHNTLNRRASKPMDHVQNLVRLRARITYFHWAGEYTLELDEGRTGPMELAPPA